MIITEKYNKKNIIFTLIISAITILLLFIPTRVGNRVKENSESVRVRVISTDNSELEQYGIVRTGNQGVQIKILSGSFKGKITNSNNILIGKLELDKMFSTDDIALAVIDKDSDGGFVYANIIDHYRLNIEFLLLLLFTGFLILYAGWTGLNASVSFLFTGVTIWKILIPCFLKGWNPVFISLIFVTLLSAVIIFLIGGLSRKGLTAFLGTCSGIIFTSVFSIVFGNAFKIHGAIKPFSETLLYSGYAHLDLSAIFLSGIFIASSGAVMDIAMDISSAMEEIRHKRPDISSRDLIISGIKVGRAVVGTMTTTLLLAYSGGYTALLMVFTAQGTPLINIINMTYVSAEILHILVGSFGLVLVAPLTALIGGIIYKKEADTPELSVYYSDIKYLENNPYEK